MRLKPGPSDARAPLGVMAAALVLLAGLLLARLQHSTRQQVVAAEVESAPEMAPQPPAQPSWRSPLRRRCDRADPGLRSRLEQRAVSLRASGGPIGIDPSNHGERHRRDAFGREIPTTPSLIVLHETVYGIGSAINTFMTPHPRDDDQVSYHALIGLDGAVVQVVDPSRRAFGAGNSAFNGIWVITNRAFHGSVNNFALHVSLETPLDGENNEPAHSGYTASQYDALAVLLAQWMQRYGIPPERITTHAHVDLGGERSDPRSFDWQALQRRLAALGMLCR
ncbi:MAG: N-acetylmuramoyl-L-alanine amidase [Synechococcaceae bacterium WB9_2_112]|nr:N-acetylmuramoyl-L-alanine amidase [Synechococcaceae bacterium WB9_2_112]